MFGNFFKKKPKPVVVKKIVEVDKVKVELFFVGKGGELENYIEVYTPLDCEGRVDRERAVGLKAKDIARCMTEEIVYRRGPISLLNSNLLINSDYYTLTKAKILDVKRVEIEVDEVRYER